MKEVLVLGAGGFIGRNVTKLLVSSGVGVVTASFNMNDNSNEIIDLSDQKSITNVLRKYKPKKIINCAGVVENSPKSEMNFVFTKNLLDVVLQIGLDIERIVIMGSAGEYGVVADATKPINEEAELKADSLYGLSKVKETTYAIQKSNEAGLSLAVARLFNPIGVGMHPRMLVPRVIDQLNTSIENSSIVIEVNRLDALRDYVGINDVAHVLIEILIKDNLNYDVYNIGSGKSTSNKTLLDLIVNAFNLSDKVEYLETAITKEPSYAARADINRLHDEIGWLPQNKLDDVIKEMADNARKQF